MLKNKSIFQKSVLQKMKQNKRNKIQTKYEIL